jgi:hypothetical protein
LTPDLRLLAGRRTVGFSLRLSFPQRLKGLTDLLGDRRIDHQGLEHPHGVDIDHEGKDDRYGNRDRPGTAREIVACRLPKALELIGHGPKHGP